MADCGKNYPMARNKASFLADWQYGDLKPGEQGTAAGEYAGPAARSALRSSAQGLLRPLRAFRCSRFPVEPWMM